jgi:hypothetical protein
MSEKGLGRVKTLWEKVQILAAVVSWGTCALQKGDEPVAALEKYLLERGWPDDRRFESAFIEFPLYERAYTREVLYQSSH